MTLDKEPGAEEFGRRLKARREELGMSRRDVVDATGLSYPYVSQLETGYRLPSHKSVARLAAALEMKPADLSAAIPYPDQVSGHSPPSAEPAEWRTNPAYHTVPPRNRKPSSPSRVGSEIAQLVSSLPRHQRLDALSRAQRQVMEQLVAEEVDESR